MNRCVYCGHRTKWGSRACEYHADLSRIEAARLRPRNHRGQFAAFPRQPEKGKVA